MTTKRIRSRAKMRDPREVLAEDLGVPYLRRPHLSVFDKLRRSAESVSFTSGSCLYPRRLAGVEFSTVDVVWPKGYLLGVFPLLEVASRTSSLPNKPLVRSERLCVMGLETQSSP